MAPPLTCDDILQFITYLSTLKGCKAESVSLADLYIYIYIQRTVYSHKWSPVSCRSNAGQGKFVGQRPTFYHCATPPTDGSVERSEFNHLIGTLKLQSSTVISTLAVDGWAVTFGTAMRGLGGLRPRPVPSGCTKM